MLKARLQQRMQQREQLMQANHESEMKTLITGPNKFAAKIRRAMLVHKHMIKMEKFRYVLF